METLIKVQPGPIIDELTEDGRELTQLPYPFFVRLDGTVARQDFWHGDPYRVLGFAKDLAVQKVNLWWADAAKDPQAAVGMYLVTADSKGDFSTHNSAISDVEVIER